ncbi:alanine dehydrogenase/PNT, N-terminal domain protein [Halobacteriovorax sp. BALOs_7]|uniref:saccharopine dehydrogenase n=1 Tax=Halobacteriovorax sp. BALOs_7 TaxID=2109558 RepID=UPI000EA11500|nr:saccharopine dehydrogenase [Halobacteriovorax sp. BALOs_7]AYF45678.1 alanine dehydrogenase/PNT, N-terminal domain protein [Halobacteriovorax sp. BALOs_7]
MTTIWLRDEDKEFEKRTPLTPENAKKLLDAGYKVIVEKSNDRIFPIQEYEKLGCEIKESHAWIEEATVSDDVFILGLKELKETDTFPLKHNHIYFAHIYKGQNGAEKVFHRYSEGQGTLFDLEFLLNEDKRRVAAFGYWAGYVGAALSVENFFSESPAPLRHYSSKDEWLKVINEKRQGKRNPCTFIIGALGRCGSGARELLDDLELESVNWDVDETKKGGPFEEIINADIFINTVLMTTKIPPFLDKSLMERNQKLSYICDVSCDPNSDLNPIPIYDVHTTWDKPLHRIESSIDHECNIIAIDNLPSALPKESSIDYSNQLIPHLLELKNAKNYFTWSHAKEIFETKKSANK